MRASWWAHAWPPAALSQRSLAAQGSVTQRLEGDNLGQGFLAQTRRGQAVLVFIGQWVIGECR